VLANRVVASIVAPHIGARVGVSILWALTYLLGISVVFLAHAASPGAAAAPLGAELHIAVDRASKYELIERTFQSPFDAGFKTVGLVNTETAVPDRGGGDSGQVFP
jgi:hypothetical protein